MPKVTYFLPVLFLFHFIRSKIAQNLVICSGTGAHKPCKYPFLAQFPSQILLSLFIHSLSHKSFLSYATILWQLYMGFYCKPHLNQCDFCSRPHCFPRYPSSTLSSRALSPSQLNNISFYVSAFDLCKHNCFRFGRWGGEWKSWLPQKKGELLILFLKGFEV